MLRVGVQGAFKPWSFPAPDGTLQGIEVDLGKEVAEKLGVKFEPVIITSADRMQFLQQSKIDLIIGGMYDTAERRKIIGIIEPAYWTSGPTLLAKKGVIKDWKDIAGKPVCAKQGVAYNKLVETQYKSPLTAFAGNTEGKEHFGPASALRGFMTTSALLPTSRNLNGQITRCPCRSCTTIRGARRFQSRNSIRAGARS